MCSCPKGDWEARKAAAIFLRSALIPPWFHGFELDTYPDQKSAALKAVRRWVAEYPKRKRSLLFWGVYGVGKTGLAVGAMRALTIKQPRPCTFLSSTEFLRKLRATFQGGPDADAEIEDARDAHVLLLDDIGAERGTDWATKELEALVDYRHGLGTVKTTIITTNGTLRQLADRMGVRTADRLLEMCAVVEVSGPNLRERGAKGESGQ